MTAAASPPARGAWIATLLSYPTAKHVWGRLPRGGRGSQLAQDEVLAGPEHVASREGGVDRNALWGRYFWPAHTSPPARGAWIATRGLRQTCLPRAVASREGGVDRNTLRLSGRSTPEVASREGGVDRNCCTPFVRGRRGVASREGGVDRNLVREEVRLAN